MQVKKKHSAVDGYGAIRADGSLSGHTLLAHLGQQVPCVLTPTVWGYPHCEQHGAIGVGESAMPVLKPGGSVTIVAFGHAWWVWDVEQGDGKGERRLKIGIGWSVDHRVVEGAELAAFV